MAFAPDGRTLATGSADTTVILWDLVDRARPHQLGRLTGHTESVAVIPDAWFELSVAGRRPEPIAVELDRGTEDQKRWRGKVAALAAWAAGPYREAFDAQTLTIAVVTPEAACRDTLRAWTGRELARRGQQLAEIFLFTSADPVATPPEQLFFAPCWYEPEATEPGSLLLPAPQPAAPVLPLPQKTVWPPEG